MTYTCAIMYGSPDKGLLTPFPIVVQHTRLDSRQVENALLSTAAHASND